MDVPFIDILEHVRHNKSISIDHQYYLEKLKIEPTVDELLALDQLVQSGVIVTLDLIEGIFHPLFPLSLRHYFLTTTNIRHRPLSLFYFLSDDIYFSTDHQILSSRSLSLEIRSIYELIRGVDLYSLFKESFDHVFTHSAHDPIYNRNGFFFPPTDVNFLHLARCHYLEATDDREDWENLYLFLDHVLLFEILKKQIIVVK